MKSKKKFLSLLVFAPLLVGCGNNVSKPKFAKYSNEVATFEKFVEELTKAQNKLSLYKEAKVGSLELKGEYKSLDVSDTLRSKKSIEKSTDYTVIKESAQYDASSLILIRKSENVTTNEIKDKNGTYFESDTTKADKQYQTKDNANGTSIDRLSKEYEEFSYESKKPAEFFDASVKSQFKAVLGSGMSEVLSHYEVEEKDNFKFYKDGNIFTVVETFEEKQEYEDSSYKSKVTFMAQVDTAEGNWLATYYSEFESTRTYKKNYASRAKGDVVVDKELESNVVTAKAKDLKLKKLDLSKYSKAPVAE